MTRLVCMVCLLFATQASAADVDEFTTQMRELQRDYGNVVVAVRGRDAPALHDALEASPVAGVSFRTVRPSIARKTVERAGAQCGLLATAVPTGWRTTLLGRCVVSEPPLLSAAYQQGSLMVHGSEVLSTAGVLTAAEVALRFGDADTLADLERRRRSAQVWGGTALATGLIFSRFVGPVLLVGSFFAAIVVSVNGGEMGAVTAVAVTGAVLTVVGIPLAIAGGLVMVRGGQGRGKVHRYYTPEELQTGVSQHNDRLAAQLGYERGASLQRGPHVEWALLLTPVGPRAVGRF